MYLSFLYCLVQEETRQEGENDEEIAVAVIFDREEEDDEVLSLQFFCVLFGCLF